MVIRNASRERVVSSTPLVERRLKLNGISTAILEGGEGPALVLLHGAGGFAAAYLRMLPKLVRTHRVIAPDLPGHGESAIWAESPSRALLSGWLDDLLDCCCDTAPVLVGQTLGGAIAAGYAAERSDRIAALVLVDTLGLADFQPAPEFGTALQAYLSVPSRQSHDLLMRQCLFDLPRVQAEMGEQWQTFVAYMQECALAPGHIAALGALMQQVGMPAMRSEELESIAAPTTLIWGRRDRATPLAVAERASARYGWPLHVVEDAADEPMFEQPDRFLAALRTALSPVGARSATA
jgi:pimeloyl-ACP methyl ester carboxylesterase